MRDRRWSLLEDARVALTDAFAADDVTQIVYAAAFPYLDGFTVYLCTSTDTQRDALGSVKRFQGQDAVVGAVSEVEVAVPAGLKVRAILEEHGFTAAELSELITLAQSQETVDRDYRGRWFDAIR